MQAPPQPVESARAAALGLLARSDRSRAALAQHLASRFDCDVLDRALDQLEREGLLDDRAAASRLAERWRERDLLAPPGIAQRLSQKGFSSQTVVEVTAALPFEEAAELARAIARWGLDPQRPGRLAGKLVRAGYDPEAVADAIHARLGE